MPEGPSIVILKEDVQEFTGKKVIAVSGNAKIDLSVINNQIVRSFKTWGKHFLICFDAFSIKIHLLMFGSYKINEQKETPARLSLKFKKGEINFYTCSVKLLEGDINSHYDWSADVMSENWDAKKAKQKIKKQKSDEMICDTLLDQDIFSGVGNIIKNEVLYRSFIHPESFIGAIPPKKLTSIIDECRKYSFEFLHWKKKNELKKHWLAYAQKVCSRCDLPMLKKNTGFRNRNSFYCENCQKKYQ